MDSMNKQEKLHEYEMQLYHVFYVFENMFTNYLKIQL
jgi:hypothetical protein